MSTNACTYFAAVFIHSKILTKSHIFRIDVTLILVWEEFDLEIRLWREANYKK